MRALVPALGRSALGTVEKARAAGRERLAVAVALAVLYLVWGSTFLAIRIALEGFPPFLMGGLRFLLAGGVLYAVLRGRGAPAPAAAEWRSAALVGALLLAGGNGGVAYAEQWVASGLAALVIATTPIWASLFAGLWGRWPGRLEWLGLVLGLAGVALLNAGSDLRAHPAGAIALLLAATTWAFGSVWSRQLSLPSGMMASAAQMLAGGTFMCLVSLLLGERPVWPLPGRAIAAFGYLVVAGSLVGFSTFTYLLHRVRPALATSYAYVNPLVAVSLGAGVAGEPLTGSVVAAMLLTLAGVALIVLARKRTVPRRRTQP